ncbi:hypothetical protein V6N11_014252, partial [Hibiscus sabdariffa]
MAAKPKAIHRAVGPQLREACFKVLEVQPGVRCPTGKAMITLGFKLPASRVIHIVGPIYDSDNDPKGSLRNAYKNCLTVAKENNIKYIAFPAISCGVFGCTLFCFLMTYMIFGRKRQRTCCRF